jgi:hypothetical protein
VLEFEFGFFGSAVTLFRITNPKQAIPQAARIISRCDERRLPTKECIKFNFGANLLQLKNLVTLEVVKSVSFMCTKSLEGEDALP